jgi:hypothetical protein
MTPLEIAMTFVISALDGIEDSEYTMLWYVTERSWFANPSSLDLFIVLCEMGLIGEVEEYPMADDWHEFLIRKLSQ